jgi:hypothetical protein
MFDVDFSGFCWLWTIGLILVDFGGVDDGWILGVSNLGLWLNG